MASKSGGITITAGRRFERCLSYECKRAMSLEAEDLYTFVTDRVLSI
jgi:hypothetical protein